MTYPKLDPINIALSSIITYLIYISGIVGALLALFPTVDFVLTPNLATASRGTVAVIAMAGFLAIGTAGWHLNRHYADMAHNRQCNRPSKNFRDAYLNFAAIFALFAGIFAFLFCLIGLLAVGPDANLLILTGLMAAFSAGGYCLVDKT